MALRCLLFSSDGEAATPICQVLPDLGVEGDHCSEALDAVDKVTHEPFQIVVIDWDNQPEAGLVLTAARERKASERPLILAIVSNDASVPKALQAGANSILRKPILINQVKDTLTTARDLLRAKETAATAQAAAAAASAGSAATFPSRVQEQKPLRAGDFLQSTNAPASHLVTDTVAGEESTGPIDPLKDLEPVAAAVAAPAEPLPAPPGSEEPKGLEWYLKTRGVARPAPSNAPPSNLPSPPKPDKPELLGFDQTPSYPQPVASAPEAEKTAAQSRSSAEQEHKEEQKLFAYIAGEGEKEKKEKKAQFHFSLGKGPIIAAAAIAACAIVAAPQAPWHPQLQAGWKHGQQALHTWLNPQPVTTPQAPPSHESFGRAGDEYKLPVAEAIPDATTDPSQIRVVPVVDPTAKKTPNVGSPDAATPPSDGSTTPADGTSQAPQGNQPATGTPLTGIQAAAGAAASAISSTPNVPTDNPSPQTPISTPAPAPAVVRPAPPRNPQPESSAAPERVPSSLKTQIASMTPDASGNKPIEAALPAIEPVAVPEATERQLLSDQPVINYPSGIKGQSGKVILQVLIGRDGSVQDAKFQQGSLAFARAAIDGVKLWKFKPYVMNGRPVSVQTTMTLTITQGS